ncbi:hypothetical protein B2J93_3108 [Marssonina coronariae]|uniref:DUF1740-domain-containing protein n=1 Tax=Diplocarpon coronariae TaxID=2795749 RepID=A0A218YS66_9HELO|nr:hypothetical protein B2J93_3108 [Marssonina coronariae]
MSNPSNVPKFASFKPKQYPPAPIDAKQKPPREYRHRSRLLGEKEDQKWQHQRHRSRSREKSHTQAEREAVTLLVSPTDPFPKPFFIDRQGDEKNLVYGSVHRYSVPPFNRFGSGHVLGAPSYLRIDRNYREDKEIVLSNSRNFKAREKYVFSKAERQKPRLLKIRSEVSLEDSAALESDFVPLQARQAKKRKPGSNFGSSSDEAEERDYRSIYQKKDSNSQPLDENLQYATESESSGSDAGRTIKEDVLVRLKNVELSREVEKSPLDIEAWLALIEHQDTLMKAGKDRHRTTSAELKSTADIKVHLYEKALGNSRSLEDREKLLLGLMTEGAKIWDTKTQTERWEQISKDNIDSLLLWSSYVNFKQSTFSTFRYDEVRNVFLRRIKLLQGAIETATGNDIEALYQQLLYVTLRLTIFVRASGYTELAVAIWQGLLEMNFNAPEQLLAETEFLISFKDFWESEVARIGDDDSRGWAHYVTYGSDVEIPDTLIDEVEDIVDNSNIFESWAAAERIRTKYSQVPARTMDEVVEDDPYRVIMHSDLEDYMIHLPLQSEKLHLSCIDAFLLFCSLPPIATTLEVSRKWANDPFICDKLLECSSVWNKGESFPASKDEEQDEGMPAFLYNSFPNCLVSPELLFGEGLAGNHYFGRSTSTQSSPSRARHADNSGPVSYRWIRNILAQLTKSHFTESLAEYYLAFEHHYEPSTIKKVAKSLLKQHPSSLRLYNAYAMIEWYHSNKEIANGVFTAALNMSHSTPNSEHSTDAIMLWRNWAWLCLSDCDNTSALAHLLSISSGRPDPVTNLTPTLLLKAQHHLLSTRDYLSSSKSFSQAALYTDCLALLTYLTASPTNEPQSPNQGSIVPALNEYATYSQTLLTRQQPVAQELLLQSAARLLQHHASIGPFRPSLIRTHLSSSLSHFPQNTIFLSLFTWTESRMRVENRVRAILLKSILTPENDTLSSRLFAIKFELRHGTIHSAKAAFERAVAAPSSRGSAGLWSLYVSFCWETREFRALVKEVWYRALRACPWAKELYIYGLERPLEGLEWEEMKGTWRVMGEKELRVHVDLEDRFEEIEERSKSTQKRVGCSRG